MFSGIKSASKIICGIPRPAATDLKYKNMGTGLTEIQCFGIILLATLTGSMFGVSFGVIARFLGDRHIT